MKKGLSLLALAISQCYANTSTPDLFSERPYYSPRLNLSADYQSKSHSFGFFDGFLPFSGNNNNIWFIDARFLNRNQGASQGNLGLGHRHLLENRPWIVGAYGFFDRRLSFDNNYFSALTLGGELKAVDWSLGTNVYVPVGTTVKADRYAQNAQLVPSAITGIYNIYYNQGKEAALLGADIEAGHDVPVIPGLTAYAGAYGYPSAHGVNNRVGPLVRAEYNLSDSGLLGEHPFMDSTVIEGFMRHDSFAGTNYYVGLKFSLNLDGTPRYKMDPLQRHMVDPVWKDLDVITATDAMKTPILDVNANGTPVNVAIASNFNQLQTLINKGIDGQHIDVIGINGTIRVPNTLIQLQAGQALTGGLYDFAPGRTVPVGKNGALESFISNIPLVQVQKNNTIEHLTFNMFGTTILNGVLINEIAIQGSSVGNLNLLYNTFNNSGIDIEASDGSVNNVLNIIGNKFKLLNQDPLNLPYLINPISILASNNSFIRVAHIDENSVTMSINSTNNGIANGALLLAGLNASTDKSSIQVDSMKANDIQLMLHSKPQLSPFAPDLNGIKVASGFYDSNLEFQISAGTVSASQVVGNQIQVTNEDANAIVTGINIWSNNLKLNDITDNSIFIDSAHSAFPIDIQGLRKMDIDNVSNNQLNATGPIHEAAYGGLRINPRTSFAQMNVSNINNNTIDLPIAGSTINNGISISMPTGTGYLNVTNVLNNHITFRPFNTKPSLGISSAGIYIGTPVCSPGEFNTNTLTIAHINGNTVETKAFNLKKNPSGNGFFGILIQASSNSNSDADNVHLNINDISSNYINTQATGSIDKARGIELITRGVGTFQNITNNTINLNTPSGKDVAGIYYNVINNTSSNNTSFNNINVVGSGSVYGIRVENGGSTANTHSGFYNNQIAVNGPSNTTYGLDFIASASSGVLNIYGVQGNNISLSPGAYGIFSSAVTGATVNIVAVPTELSLSPSAANGGTRYGTKGNVNPKA